MKAFDEIYTLYVDDIYRYLLALTRDKNIAEELTQETFYKAYKAIDSFEGKCKMLVWLCQIAKNSYFTYCRKEKRKPKEALNENMSSVINVQEEVIQSQDVIVLHKILHTIEEPYKEVFTLRLFGELPFRQIGEIFGKSESWARVTYYRAKEKIKVIFKEMEGLS